MQFEEKFLRINEETNAIDYLSKAEYYIKKAETSDIAWKWVTIALHGALYGFAIAASSGTDSCSVIDNNGKLLSFWKALRRCEDTRVMYTLVDSKALVLTSNQKNSIEILTSLLRNNFAHFSPKSWSIELHGMPQVALDIIEVISFLCFETKTYILLDHELREEVKKRIQSCINTLKGMTLYKNYKEMKKTT